MDVGYAQILHWAFRISVWSWAKLYKPGLSIYHMSMFCAPWCGFSLFSKCNNKNRILTLVVFLFLWSFYSTEYLNLWSLVFETMFYFSRAPSSLSQSSFLPCNIFVSPSLVAHFLTFPLLSRLSVGTNRKKCARCQLALLALAWPHGSPLNTWLNQQWCSGFLLQQCQKYKSKLKSW